MLFNYLIYKNQEKDNYLLLYFKITIHIILYVIKKIYKYEFIHHYSYWLFFIFFSYIYI